MGTLKGDTGTSGVVPPNNFAVWGDSTATDGVVGTSQHYAVRGITLANSAFAGTGILGDSQSTGGTGVAGTSTGGTAIWGIDYGTGGIGVLGTASKYGVSGQAGSGTGVFGRSSTGSGVWGQSDSSAGVYGSSTSNNGVVGVSSQRIGVYGISNDTAIFAWGGRLAGYFIGDVIISGNLSKGGGGFIIDHPLDPEQRYLQHSFVESSERRNFYDGVAICDQHGEAVIELPTWFEALNRELRYQLTSIGGPAPNLHVAAEVHDGRFKIAGGTPSLKVSWQITGERQDAWAKANPLRIEDNKNADERGYFLHPEAHGHAMDRGINRKHHDEAQKHLKQPKAPDRMPDLEKLRKSLS